MRVDDNWSLGPGPGVRGPVLSACSPQLKSEENQGQCSVLSAGRGVNTEHTGRENVPGSPDTRHAEDTETGI